MWEIPNVGADTIVVLGGGPSLRDSDFSLVKSQAVIGTNNAFELGDWVDYNFFMDVRWWRDNKDLVQSYKGVLVTDAPDPACEIDSPVVKRIKRYNDIGLTVRNDGLPWNRNSGAGAVCLAACMGAKRIILLGFDMHQPNGQNNWHNRHKNKTEARMYGKFMSFFNAIRLDLDKINSCGSKLEIINCTPNSAMTFFPMMKLEDAL